MVEVHKMVFRTPCGRKWHICKSFDAFGPISWCGIERMWRWVEEAKMGQIVKEEICRTCLQRVKGGGEA